MFLNLVVLEFLEDAYEFQVFVAFVVVQVEDVGLGGVVVLQLSVEFTHAKINAQLYEVL